MDNSTDLNPQVPGQTPNVNLDALSPLLALALVDLVAGLPALTDTEIEELRTLEAAGENRAEYIDALTTEQVRRLEDAEPGMPPAEPTPENAPAPLGDVASYSRMAASEIDPRTLERAVLSRDGWVLPSPAAKSE